MRRPSRERSACYKRWLRTQPNIMHVMLASIFIYHVEDGQKLLTHRPSEGEIVNIVESVTSVVTFRRLSPSDRTTLGQA